VVDRYEGAASESERVVMYYLLTFGTYGTRLHGDARGSFERGGQFASKNGALESYERRLLRAAPFSLDRRSREIVVATIKSVCAHRGWPLRAVHCRIEHVHAVIDVDIDPRRAVAVLKAWCTRALLEAALVERERPIWSRGCNASPLRDERAVEEARSYVLNRQGELMAYWRGGEEED
jgi:hypothetical protein